MKKVITIMCLAAAPMIFAQQKAAAEFSPKSNVKTEKSNNQGTQSIKELERESSKVNSKANTKKVKDAEEKAKSEKAAIINSEKNKINAGNVAKKKK